MGRELGGDEGLAGLPFNLGGVLEEGRYGRERGWSPGRAEGARPRVTGSVGGARHGGQLNRRICQTLVEAPGFQGRHRW